MANDAAAPEPQNAEAVSNEALMQRIADLEAQSAQIQAANERIATLEAQLAAANSARQLVTSVPADAGGLGTDIAETWSQWDQEMAWAGTHPLQQEG